MTDISNSDDVIDSRDVIARIKELTDEREALQEAINEAAAIWAAESDARSLEEALESPKKVLTDWEEENAEELKNLETFQKEAEGYADDWEYGATLIREDYFTEYCEEMVKDIGDLPQNLPGYLVIDWQTTADNLRVDYTEAEFDGVTYLVR